MLPDFFIVGAMKAGTTTLHSVLSVHPDICMSVPKEPFIIDRDDVWTHRNFFIERPEAWLAWNWQEQKEKLHCEYKKVFKGARAGQILGESSSSYMGSKKAPGRIFQINPDAKILFMLRDPVERAYSSYWHRVANGGIIYTFEKQIEFDMITILERGLYKEQIQRYLAVFPCEKLCFCIFEEFVNNMQKEVDRICDFLNVERKVDISLIGNKTRQNIARCPRFYRLGLVLNFLGRWLGAETVTPILKGQSNRREKYLISLIKKLQNINLSAHKYPPMKPLIKRQLEEFYRGENLGLGEIVKVDLSQYWPYMK